MHFFRPLSVASPKDVFASQKRIKADPVKVSLLLVLLKCLLDP